MVKARIYDLTVGAVDWGNRRQINSLESFRIFQGKSRIALVMCVVKARV